MRKIPKVYLAGIVLALVLFSFAGLVFADTETVQGVAAKFNFLVNGQDLKLAEQPVVINGRTYLPVRALGEALGKRVGWDENSQTVVIDELLKDGVYKASEADFNEHGWKAMVELTVKNGQIESVTYEEIDKDGNLKTQSEAYLQQYKDVTKADLLESYAKLQTSLVTAQNVELVDAVSGATYASYGFKALVKQALEAGPIAAQ